MKFAGLPSFGEKSPFQSSGIPSYGCDYDFECDQKKVQDLKVPVCQECLWFPRRFALVLAAQAVYVSGFPT